MDIDRLRRWRVTQPNGRARSYSRQSDAEAAAKPGAKIAPHIVWQVRFRDPTGKQRSRNFQRKPDAELFASTTQVDIARGVWVDPVSGRTTFREYAEEWRLIQMHRPGTQAQVEMNLRNHVYPYLGDRPVGAIRSTEIQTWVQQCRDGLSPATVRLIYNYVATILTDAVNNQIIVRNPCRGTRLPDVDRPAVQPITLERLDTIAESIDHRYRGLVLFAAGAGLRQGECFGLTVDRLDMLRRTVTVDRQMQPIAGDGLVLCQPKTKRSHRTVPLGDATSGTLAAHLAEFPATEHAMKTRLPTGKYVERAERLVFTNSHGDPIRRSTFGAVWRDMVEKAKLPEGTHFHELRHFYASMLIRHGLSPKVVQARLGHASIIETMDTYGHLWPDDDDRTREAVDAELGAERDRLGRALDG